MNSGQLCLAGVARKASQDYTALADYLPAEVWNELLGNAQSSQAKLNVFCFWLIRWGCAIQLRTCINSYVACSR